MFTMLFIIRNINITYENTFGKVAEVYVDELVGNITATINRYFW